MPIDDGFLPRDFATKHQGITNDRKGKKTRLSQVGRRLIQFGAELCHVRFRHRYDPQDTSKDPLWSDLLYYFNYYLAIKSLAALYLQYVFDYHNYKLYRFDQIAGQRQDATLRHFRDQLVANYEYARKDCKLLGAPLIELSFLFENGMAYLILLTNINYLVPQLLPFSDVAIVFIVLDPHKFQAAIDSLVRDQVNRFILSGRCRLANESIEQKEAEGRHHDTCGADYEHVVYEDHYDRRIRLYRSYKNHKYYVARVKSMAYRGVFQPYNRREDRVTEMADMYNLLIVVLFPITLCTWVLFMFVLPRLYLMDVSLETDPMDKLFIAEMLVGALIGSTCTCTYISSAVMMCLDQVYFVLRLCHLINDCIQTNTRGLVEYIRDISLPSHRLLDPTMAISPHVEVPVGELAPDLQQADQASIDLKTIMVRQSYDEVERRINLSLLHTLLHYKIFVKQLRSYFTVFKIYASLTIVIIYLYPLITRLFIAYLDKRMQRMTVVVSLVIALIIDCSLVMICWLHERCLDIYRHLQSLMAHIVAMNTLARVHTNRTAYDEHLTWMLRSELDHPERLTDQFSTRLLITKTSVTYASLLKFHFWWGILTISIMIIDPSLPNARDIFGGIWRFYRDADADVIQFFSNVTLC